MCWLVAGRGRGQLVDFRALVAEGAHGRLDRPAAAGHQLAAGAIGGQRQRVGPFAPDGKSLELAGVFVGAAGGIARGKVVGHAAAGDHERLARITDRALAVIGIRAAGREQGRACRVEADGRKSDAAFRAGDQLDGRLLVGSGRGRIGEAGVRLNLGAGRIELRAALQRCHHRSACRLAIGLGAGPGQDLEARGGGHLAALGGGGLCRQGDAVSRFDVALQIAHDLLRRQLHQRADAVGAGNIRLARVGASGVDALVADGRVLHPGPAHVDGPARAAGGDGLFHPCVGLQGFGPGVIVELHRAIDHGRHAGRRAAARAGQVAHGLEGDGDPAGGVGALVIADRGLDPAFRAPRQRAGLVDLDRRRAVRDVDGLRAVRAGRAARPGVRAAAGNPAGQDPGDAGDDRALTGQGFPGRIRRIADAQNCAVPAVLPLHQRRPQRLPLTADRLRHHPARARDQTERQHTTSDKPATRPHLPPPSPRSPMGR